MRTWLYNRLKNMPTLPLAWQSAAIISSGSADNPSAPFMVLTLGVEQTAFGMPAEARVQSVPFTVWLHDRPGSMLSIDEAAVALKNYLPTEDGFVVGSMSVLNVKWAEIGQDAADDHYSTNCRPVRFSMTTRR